MKLLTPTTRFGQIVVEASGGLAVFVLVLWWWFSSAAPVAVEKTFQKVEQIERYTKGGAYPRISVEPYFGPRDGIRRTLFTSPEGPGFLAVFVENTNDFPIFDLEIGMIDFTPEGRNPQTMEKFNGEFSKKIRQMQILHPNKTLSYLLPANPALEKLGFDFNAKTRAGVTWHKFRFLVVSNRWEFARTIVDIRTSDVIEREMPSNYPRNFQGEPAW